MSEINIPDDTTASELTLDYSYLLDLISSFCFCFAVGGGTLKHDFENFDMDFGGGMQDIPIEFQFPNESTDIEVQRKSATAELIGDYSDLNGDDSKTKNYKVQNNAKYCIYNESPFYVHPGCGHGGRWAFKNLSCKDCTRC